MVARPLAGSAQQAALPVIGFLNSASPTRYERMAAAFRKGLSEAGYVEGRNVLLEYRWANGKYDELPALAADLVNRSVNLIFANTPATQAAMALTKSIPIVFSISSDPVKDGLIASLSHPGGNITGVTQANVEVTPKRLELLHELVPHASKMALLINPRSPTLADATSLSLEKAAKDLGLELQILTASQDNDLEPAFKSSVRSNAGGLVIGSDPFFTSQSEELAALGLKHRIPAAYQYREFAAAGGLLSYGGGLTDSYRLAGVYAARILRGDNPGDLPVQQSTKVDFIINLRTAKLLDIFVSLPLSGRADEVIE
jgi:putative tryptophan/tyrosine transport system substrate-binding protein